METRTLGRTGLEVSRLGFGLAEIGGLELEEAKQAAQVLNIALDNGITFFDTAACYGNSEELIGRTIAHRRDEFILATKAGHVTGGYEGEAGPRRRSATASTAASSVCAPTIWTSFSCTRATSTLERGEVIEVIQEAQQAGKTRFIGYSGDNDGRALGRRKRPLRHAPDQLQPRRPECADTISSGRRSRRTWASS